MYNFFRFLHHTNEAFKTRFPDVSKIEHCSVIDIPPNVDVERLNIISGQVASIECLEDQLRFVKQAKILTVHKDSNTSIDEIVLDNTITKVFIVVGNVQNIRLTLDDKDTIVYHRTFGYNDETGIVIGEEIDNLKPEYHLIKSDIAFPEVSDVIRQYGIVFATEANKQSLLSGEGFYYIIDTMHSINGFRDAKIVAFRNNTTYEPEITKNVTIVYGKPSRFKGINEIEKVTQSDIIMANMSSDELKSFVEHSHILSYESAIPDACDGYSTASDYTRGISPARHILTPRMGANIVTLDITVFKVDNPFTFAFVKKRNPHTYELLRYNVIAGLENCSNDSELMKEKLRIITASRQEQELDAFRETRHDELVQGSYPDVVFLREYPRIDPFATKRIGIRLVESNLSDVQSETTKEFMKQRKNYVVQKPGNHLFTGYNFLSVFVEASDVELYVKDCGLLFITIVGMKSNVRLHIIGNIHTVFCDRECSILCYFVPHISHSLFYTENDTDDVGKFFEEYDVQHYMKLFRSSGRREIETATKSDPTSSLPRATMTKVKNLYCNSTLIKGKSLVKIDNIVELK